MSTSRRPTSFSRNSVASNSSVTIAVTTTNVAPQGRRGLSALSKASMEDVAKGVTAASASRMRTSCAGLRPGSTLIG